MVEKHDETAGWRFDFVVRVLSLAFAICLAYLGWNSYRVWERNAVRAWVKENGGFVDDGEEVIHAKIPYIRRMMGDTGVFLIGMPENTTAEQRLRILRAFPESRRASYKGSKEWAVE